MSSKRRVILFAVLLAVFQSMSLVDAGEFVTYEAFGAVGDGVHDDLPAICKAHEYAKTKKLPVRSKPGATYHLGRKALTAVITTDTDWSTSRFTIDDSTEVANHKKPLFEVRSLLKPVKLKIDRISRDQKRLGLRPGNDCYVDVRNDKVKRYIRRGLNQNSGVSQRDAFILRRDGSIEGDIDWEYDHVSSVTARPIDAKRLVLKGGVFTTIANQMEQEVGYNYWSRNIVITRSNTEVDGLHVDDSKLPANYQGMFLFSDPGGKKGADAPFPYTICRKVKIQGLTTGSGQKPRVSPNARFAESVLVVGEGG